MSEKSEPEFVCPCCGNKTYKPIFIETNKKRYAITKKKSGLTKIVKIREFGINVRISKDVAECLNCSYHTILDESEKVVPKETKRETTGRLTAYRFDGHFLDPR